MNRRGFLGLLLSAAVAPKTMLAPPAPSPWFFGGRVVYADTDSVVFKGDLRSAYPKKLVMKLYTNSLYGKFA